jgi:hypothetical protein
MNRNWRRGAWALAAMLGMAGCGGPGPAVTVSAREGAGPPGAACPVLGEAAAQERWLGLIDAAFEADFELEELGRGVLKRCGVEE